MLMKYQSLFDKRRNCTKSCVFKHINNEHHYFRNSQFQLQKIEKLRIKNY